MNRQITTEEAILNKSKKYILKNGISSFNMRNIAQECGISIGTVYNYFPSKTKLVIATVESVWKEIFEPFDHLTKSNCFIEAVQCMYQIIEKWEYKIPWIFFYPLFKFCHRRKKRRN